MSIVGGLVFKRDLRSSVRDTAIDAVSMRIANGEEEADVFGYRPLEDRLLPALVVRCAQHILRWGLQEEGLFRYVRLCHDIHMGWRLRRGPFE